MRSAISRKHILLLTTLGSICLILLFLVIFSKKRVNIQLKYHDKYDVALYIKTYHELPCNYVTWYSNRYNCLKYGDEYLVDDSIIIGGDDHKNTGELEQFGINNIELLKECDIKDDGYSREYKIDGKVFIKGIRIQGSTPGRGEHRLVYTTHTGNVRVFETPDHYKTFTEITDFDIMPSHYISLYIFIVFTIISIITATLVVVYDVEKSRKQEIEKIE